MSVSRQTAADASGSVAVTPAKVDPEAEAAIRSTVLDDEGLYDADAGRMGRALHPSLAKRSWDLDQASRRAVRTTTAEQVINWTAAGEGRDDALGDRTVDIEVIDVSADIASVVADTKLYHEYLHLVRVPDGWRILDVLWRYQDGHGPAA